ncbi:MAG: hypothetical protein E4H17_01860 [Gemmatimonadales bacterium]|nr:MAG: hypothetical protein E4H17_01860 [Gemmatimonadales bacterium]
MKLTCVLACLLASAAAADDSFARRWTYPSETSAVVYWQLDDMTKEALSRVEWGTTDALGQSTPATTSPRWGHLHRLTGLEPDATVHYRMVVVDPATKQETKSEILTLATRRRPDALRVPDQVKGPPFVLDKPGATYILMRDVTAPGDAFVITAPDVTLDLDGHTVTFGNDTDKQVFGVNAQCKGPATVCNGHLAQGARSGKYSAAVESRWIPEPREVFGISTDVHLPCAYPVRGFGACAGLHIHHNHLASRVTEVESRHYPGNDLLRLDIQGGNIHVHDNLLTGGCHRGMGLTGEGPNVEVDHNDVRHHQQYVNGYAFGASCAGLDIHHNRVTSHGRGVHLTAEGIRFHHNAMSLRGHQQLDDIPAKSRPFKHQIVELHGVKFEGRKVKNCTVHDNFVQITQELPRDSGGEGTPDDKLTSGVYVRSKATAVAAGRLTDSTQAWEKDRWKGYWVKYSPALPPARIAGNDATSLFGEFQAAEPGDYALYMKWQYVPATPLNIACYDPNARNEVYGNTFVALTRCGKTRHGGYGDSGQWAAAVYFVGMTHGPAAGDGYAIHVHDNRFVSNDLFVASQTPVNMTVRIEKNLFTLSTVPPPVEGHTPFRRLGADLEASIQAGGNTFHGMKP